MTAQTTTPMKRAGQLIAHLSVLHQISDVRQLLLLQLVMRERQDQAALFRRSEQEVTLNLIGVQTPLSSSMLTHRAGTVSAAALLDQLQGLSGIQGNDVAFSSGQINDLIAGRTQAIEQSDELARLDAALNAMINRAHQEPNLQLTSAHPAAAQPRTQVQQAEQPTQEPERNGPDYTPDDLERHVHEEDKEAFDLPTGDETSVPQQDLSDDIHAQAQSDEAAEHQNHQAPEGQTPEAEWSAGTESQSEPDAAEEPQAVPTPAPRRGRRPA